MIGLAFQRAWILWVAVAVCLIAYPAQSDTSITVKNSSASPLVTYVEIDNYKGKNGAPGPISDQNKQELAGLKHPCQFPSNVYAGQGNEFTCHFTLPAAASQEITVYGSEKMSVAISGGPGHFPQGPCNTRPSKTAHRPCPLFGPPCPSPKPSNLGHSNVI